jgi:hypothetical protein
MRTGYRVLPSTLAAWITEIGGYYIKGVFLTWRKTSEKVESSFPVTTESRVDAKFLMRLKFDINQLTNPYSKRQM